MKTLINYILCSFILSFGLLMLLCDDFSASLLGILWFVSVYILSKKKGMKYMWTLYWITNIKIQRAFGLY